MKVLGLFLCLLNSFSFANAANLQRDSGKVYPGDRIVVERTRNNDDIVLVRPAALKFRNIEANSDGTVTVFNPTFKMRGQWLPFDTDVTEGEMVCRLLNKNYVLVPNSLFKIGVSTLVMNYENSHWQTATYSMGIESVTCERRR